MEDHEYLKLMYISFSWKFKFAHNWGKIGQNGPQNGPFVIFRKSVWWIVLIFWHEVREPWLLKSPAYWTLQENLSCKNQVGPKKESYMWKSKTRVTSYEFKFRNCEFKFKSYEFELPRSEFKSTSYEFKSTSNVFKFTSYEFKSTS